MQVTTNGNIEKAEKMWSSDEESNPVQGDYFFPQIHDPELFLNAVLLYAIVFTFCLCNFCLP